MASAQAQVPRDGSDVRVVDVRVARRAAGDSLLLSSNRMQTEELECGAVHMIPR